MKLARFWAMPLALLIASIPVGAVQVDFNTSRDITSTTLYGFQHLVTALGYGGGDRNGPGSTHSATVANGMVDGLEFSLFEYVLANDFSSLPDGALKTRLQGLHADAVAAFDQNWAAMLDIVDGANDDGLTCNPDNSGRLPLMEQEYADLFGNVGDPFVFPPCTTRTAFLLSLVVGVTVSLDPNYSGSVLAFLQGSPSGPPYDFVNDSNFDRSVTAIFHPSGDIDGDGVSNANEVVAVDAAIDAAGMDLSGITDGRAVSDLRYGWIIDKAVLNTCSYSPAFSNYGGTDPDCGIGDPKITLSKSWAEVGDRVDFTAILDGALGYQWYKNGNPLVDETGASLVIDPVELSDSGQYFCRITTPDKAVVDTPTVTLTVFAAGALPVAGGLGLGLLAGVAAVAGVIRLRRHQRD